MATDEATPLLQSEVEPGSDDAIRIIVADSEPIFRVGVRKIVAIEDDIRIVAQVESEQNAITAVSRYDADLILFECGLSESPADAVSNILAISPSMKIVLVMIEPTEEQTVELLRRVGHRRSTRDGDGTEGGQGKTGGNDHETAGAAASAFAQGLLHIGVRHPGQ